MVRKAATSLEYTATLQALGYICRYNEIAKRVEVNGHEYDEFIRSEIQVAMRDAGCSNRQLINDVVLVNARDNTYNPIKERFESFPAWDGTPRIRALAAYLKPKNPELAEVLLYKWMIGAVSKLYANTQNMVLCIQGEQGAGKSYFAEWLSSSFDREYFTADDLDPRDKDYQIRACTTFLWEIGEMDDTTSKKDFGTLKRFLTTKIFKVRLPYGFRDTMLPVICSYIGTVNETGGFLIDQSGNRRFWILQSGGIDFEYTNVFNPDDLWAEAYAAFKRGESFMLTADEKAANEREQNAVEVIDLTAEAMTDIFDIDPDNEEWVMPISQVRDYLSGRTHLTAAELSSRKLGAAAARLKLGKTQARVKGKTCKCYTGLKLTETEYSDFR